MKAIILAAGYGTRLGELTKNKAKPLLEVAGKPLIEYIIDKILEISSVNEIIVVSNNKFFKDFLDWSNSFECRVPIRIFDDGSRSNEDRLGAIKDMSFAMDKIQDIEGNSEEYLIVAGDNLIEFSMKNFYQYHLEHKANAIAVYDVGDIEVVRNKHGVVDVDQDGKVLEFNEKPSDPKSSIKSICCYIFMPEIKQELSEYLKDNNPDATGFFLEWLVKRNKVYAYKFEEPVHDIGDKESYLKTDELYKKKNIENV